jgi:hypothetical protein
MRSIIISIVLKFIRMISNSLTMPSNTLTMPSNTLTMPPIVMRSRLKVESMEVER